MKKTPLKQKTPLKAKTGFKTSKRRKKIYIQAHDLARAIWRTVGKCEVCGRKRPDVQLQGAHVFGTGAYPRIGSDLRNGLCLCAGCHRHYTNNPEWFTFVQESRVGKYYRTLLGMAVQREAVDWHDRIDFLKDIKKQIEAGELTLEEACEWEPTPPPTT